MPRYHIHNQIPAKILANRRYVTRTASNHSALLTSGKFNGHYPLLGFDAVRNEHGEYTSSYTPNKKELKQVEWIMASFFNVDRYNVLLDHCKEKNIKIRRGTDFTMSSLRTLLTNPRYIGKWWYCNKRNAGQAAE